MAENFRAEEALLAECFATQYPNPEGQGCPSNAEIELLVCGDLPLTDPRYLHLSECSPCFQKARAYRRERRLARRRSVMVGIGLAASVLVIAAVAFRGGQRSREPVQSLRSAPVEVANEKKGSVAAERGANRMSETSASGSDQSAPAHARPEVKAPVAAVLNFEGFGASRGGDTSREPWPTLKRRKLVLTIVLPFGAETGDYTVKFDDGKQGAITASGLARMNNGLAALTVPLDLSSRLPGDCVIAVKSKTLPWSSYPVRLE